MKIENVQLKLIYLVAFLVLTTVLYNININFKVSKINIILKNTIKEINLDKDINFYTNQSLANSVYKILVSDDEFLNTFSKFVDANTTDRISLRKMLITNFKYDYQLMRELGVLQFHFVDKNNISLLRMHKPSLYGDDLSKIRYSFLHVNKNKTKIEGFEKGSVTHAYRYVFPISDKSQNHLGAVEISFSLDNMHKDLNKMFHAYSHLIIKKNKANELYYKEKGLEKYITESIEHKDYMLAINKYDKYKHNTELKSNIIDPLQKDIYINIAKEKEFTLYKVLEKSVKTVSFLPIKNIKDKKTLSWLVVYEDNKMIYSVIQTANIIFLLSITGLMLLLYFIYRYQIARYLLEKEHKEVKESQELLNTIFDNTKESIAILDLDSKFLFVNDAYLKLTGFSKDELYATTCRELSTEDTKEITDKAIAITIEKGFYLNFEKSCYIKNKTRIDVKVNSVLLPDKNRLLLTIDDITLQKKQTIEQDQRKQQLIQQTRLAQMGEMINMIAHQWRQPLNAISLTSSNLALKCVMDDVDKEYFEKELALVSEYSQHLSKTIDDFRNFFKDDNIKEFTTLREVLNATLNIVKTSVETKNIKIIQDYNCNTKIETFPNEVMQVILNIIKNAEDILIEKNIQNPTITLEINDSVLSIKDNAGGIPDDIIHSIFDPYFSTKKEKDGTGLGLYMSKLIIEEHCDGLLSVENDKDGAVFKIDLKYKGEENE